MTTYYTIKTEFTFLEKCKLYFYKILKKPIPFEEGFDGVLVDSYYGVRVKIKKPELRDHDKRQVNKQLHPNSWKTDVEYGLGDIMWLCGNEYKCVTQHKSTVLTKDMESLYWENTDINRYPHEFDSCNELNKIVGNKGTIRRAAHW